MNVLVPISSGGEQRTGEPQYTSTQWSSLPDEDKTRYLEDTLRRPGSGVRFEFTREEALKLKDEGRFNGPPIGGYAVDLLGVTTRTIRGDKEYTMIQLLGKFRQYELQPFPNNSVVGTIFPSQLTNILDQVLL